MQPFCTDIEEEGGKKKKSLVCSKSILSIFLPQSRASQFFPPNTTVTNQKQWQLHPLTL